MGRICEWIVCLVDGTVSDLGLLKESANNFGRNRKVYVSFGGLLLYLEGPYKRLTPLRIDYVYLLMKK